MHSILVRLVATVAAVSLAACSTLRTIADRRAPGTDPSVAVTALLKPSDYVVITYKDNSQAGITITSVSSTEIVGVHDGSDAQDRIRIEDVQVIQKSERSPGRTMLLVVGSTVAGVLAFLAIVRAGFHGA